MYNVRFRNQTPSRYTPIYEYNRSTGASNSDFNVDIVHLINISIIIVIIYSQHAGQHILSKITTLSINIHVPAELPKAAEQLTILSYVSTYTHYAATNLLIPVNISIISSAC